MGGQFFVLVILSICLPSSFAFRRMSSTINNHTLTGNADIGEHCLEDVDYWEYPEKTLCRPRDWECVCNDEHVKASTTNGPVCVPRRWRIGHDCLYQEQCKFSDYCECVQSPDDSSIKECTCKEDYRSNANYTQCLRIPYLLEDYCNATEQCRENIEGDSICMETAFAARCRCSNSSVPLGNKVCLPIATKLGDPCVLETQCTAGVPGVFSKCIPEDATELN